MIYFPELIEKLRARFSDEITLPQPLKVTYEKQGPIIKEMQPNFNYTEG